MAQQDKYYLEIQKKLASENAKDVIQTLTEIKSSGRANVIPLIVALLSKNQDNEIGKEVLSVLSQLKDKEAIPYIVKEVTLKKNDSFKEKLIMTCWQSGLNYSPYILEFAEEFIRGNYQVSIEAFSVIEEWIHDTPKETITECKKHLIDSIDRISKDKKPFYHELVKLVEGYV